MYESDSDYWILQIMHLKELCQKSKNTLSKS